MSLEPQPEAIAARTSVWKETALTATRDRNPRRCGVERMASPIQLAKLSGEGNRGVTLTFE